MCTHTHTGLDIRVACLPEGRLNIAPLITAVEASANLFPLRLRAVFYVEKNVIRANNDDNDNELKVICKQ